MLSRNWYQHTLQKKRQRESTYIYRFALIIKKIISIKCVVKWSHYVHDVDFIVIQYNNYYYHVLTIYDNNKTNYCDYFSVLK